MNIHLIIQVIILLILNYFDAKTTFVAIKLNGISGEKNPIARFFIKKFGLIKGIIALKSIIIIIIPAIFYSYFDSPILTSIIVICINIIYLGVVINNFRVIKKIRNNK